MRPPFSNICTTSERLLADVGPRCTPYQVNRQHNAAYGIHSSLNIRETQGDVVVSVAAAAVPEQRTGGLQKCDMIENWSGLMCYVGADRSLGSPLLRDPRGGPRRLRPTAEDPLILRTARTGDF